MSDVYGSVCVGMCRLLKYRWGVLAAVSQQDFGTQLTGESWYDSAIKQESPAQHQWCKLPAAAERTIKID